MGTWQTPLKTVAITNNRSMYYKEQRVPAVALTAS